MFKDIIYAIQTGDTKAKLFYIFALITLIAAPLGFIFGLVGIIRALVAHNTAIGMPVLIAVISALLTIVVIVWLNKLRRI